MARWIVDAPTNIDVDNVTDLRVRIIAGSVAVLADDDWPSVEVTKISGHPLEVTHEDGVLTISHKDLSWDGLLSWLRPMQHSADLTIMVPSSCRVQLGVVSADAVVSGVTSGAAVKSMSGEVTLDRVTGDIEARTVSGALQAQEIDGAFRYGAVSGSLTLAGGTLRRLDAETVSADVAADVSLAGNAGVRVKTISGRVALRLPADSDAGVRLESVSGRVRSEFESLRPSKLPGSRSVSGTLGAGSAMVSVSSVSGAITLLRDQASPAARNAEAEMESETR